MNTDIADFAVAERRDILQLVFPHLYLADIWCLSLTSKAVGGFCLDRLAEGNFQHARDLVFNAVTAEASTPAQTTAGTTQRELLQAAVEWLLGADVIPPELFALDSTRYLCISDTSCRGTLLMAGLEITYEAVVTAARKLTKDLYKWIADCEACGSVLEINDITRAACCSSEMEMDSTFLSTPDIILDHLYMALNCMGSLDPLMDGKACNNIIDLCSLPAATEITAEAIEPFLHAFVQVFGTRGCSTIGYREFSAIEALCRLDATNRLSNAGLCGLLKAAAEALLTNEMLPLFYLSAVRQLDPAQKVEVILTVCRAFIAASSVKGIVNVVVFRRILKHLVPGVPEASRAALIKEVLAWCAKDTTGAAFTAYGVMCAPIMNGFSAAGLVELLRYVLERGAQDPRLPETIVAYYLDMLYKCPEAAEVGMAGAAQLVQLARTLSYRNETLRTLLQLQEAQQQSSQ